MHPGRPDGNGQSIRYVYVWPGPPNKNSTSANDQMTSTMVAYLLDFI